jgi:hypothetical protein
MQNRGWMILAQVSISSGNTAMETHHNGLRPWFLFGSIVGPSQNSLIPKQNKLI